MPPLLTQLALTKSYKNVSKKHYQKIQKLPRTSIKSPTQLSLEMRRLSCTWNSFPSTKMDCSSATALSMYPKMTLSSLTSSTDTTIQLQRDIQEKQRRSNLSPGTIPGHGSGSLSMST